MNIEYTKWLIDRFDRLRSTMASSSSSIITASVLLLSADLYLLTLFAGLIENDIKWPELLFIIIAIILLIVAWLLTAYTVVLSGEIIFLTNGILPPIAKNTHIASRDIAETFISHLKNDMISKNNDNKIDIERSLDLMLRDSIEFKDLADENMTRVAKFLLCSFIFILLAVEIYLLFLYFRNVFS